ncbi:SdpI family protein [Arenibacter certesii]|nr:SdpI family protein [Arenibacter certesii]
MKTKETWDFAHIIGAKMLFYLGVSTTAIGAVTYTISPSWVVVISAFSLVIGVIIGLWWCENQLIVHFDKDGKPLTPRTVILCNFQS